MPKTDNKAVAFDPANIEIVKQVTLPILKKVDNVPVYVRIDGPMFEGKEIKETTGEAKEKPATLANVTNLETGEQAQIICNAVMQSTLEEEYPDQGYVNLCFMIEQLKVEGKRYKNYRIAQIADPAA